MRILVPGGTLFLGRHFVDAALAKGHELTLFHRGQHGADLFPQARHVFGDRDGGLDALPDERWDLVVDFCGYVPRIVRQSAEALADKTDRYVFISTISVLADGKRIGQNESAPVATIEDAATEEITPESYGALKALCEAVVHEVYRERALILRPGLIMGPFDPSNRFTYWVERLGRGENVLVPARLDQPVQVIDARDIAEFILSAGAEALRGTYFLTGPAKPYTFGAMLSAIDPNAQLVPASQETLSENGVELWQNLPLALPESGESDGFMHVDVSKALKAGLTLRPLRDSVRDIAAWIETLPTDRPRPHGLEPEKEKEVLAAIARSERSVPG